MSFVGGRKWEQGMKGIFWFRGNMGPQKLRNRDRKGKKDKESFKQFCFLNI